MNTLIQKMAQLSAAEEFLDFFGIPYDQKLVNVSRLHILKRFYQYVRQESGLDKLDDIEGYQVYRNLLIKAYGDFVTSTPAQEKVFKVFQEQDGHQHVTLDSLRMSIPAKA